MRLCAAADVQAVIRPGMAVVVNAAIDELVVLAGDEYGRTLGVLQFAIDQADVARRRFLAVARLRLERQGHVFAIEHQVIEDEVLLPLEAEVDERIAAFADRAAG